ncbi:MAG: SDR family NAD(P)-dependent oxidoreductase, partial [Bacteroidota bacterium]
MFENKIAIIIGGTSGIGKATTEKLLAAGATVHIVGRSINKVADQPNLHKHQVDITRSAERESLSQ